jgi:hypothetical protein
MGNTLRFHNKWAIYKDDLVVNHIRAAHQALDADSKILHANQAQVVGQEFLTAYPGSLRAAAVRRLLERLPSID